MQESEESASETESEGKRRLRLKHKRSVIELELLKRGSELFILVCLYRVKTCEDHRLHLLETRNRLLTWLRNMSDGITHLHLDCTLDT